MWRGLLLWLQMQAVVAIYFGVYKKICVITWVSLSGYHLLSPEDEFSQHLICPWHSVCNTHGIIFSGLQSCSIKINKLVLTKLSKYFIETIFKLIIYLCNNKSCSLNTFSKFPFSLQSLNPLLDYEVKLCI